LLKKAKVLGFDYVATGHYARKIGVKLYSSRDKEKDQSYFLWKLSRGQLKHLLFPLGNYAKKEIKQKAKKLKLPVFDLPESQEICFIEKETKEFLKQRLKLKKGKIVDTQGRVLGGHFGLPLYTIGQRKGIGLPGGPYWVLDKNQKKNFLIVTKKEKTLLEKKLVFGKANWLAGSAPKLPASFLVKIRSHSEPASCQISFLGQGKYEAVFEIPQRAVAPGQSIVLYKGRELIGGGIILVS
jgi:tRNA-specific 2-thiouridylase